MFRTRLISGIVLVVIALAVIIAGGPVLAATLLVISLIGMNEFYKAMDIEKRKGISLLTLPGYLGCVFYYLLVFLDIQAYTMTVLLGVLILLMAVYVFTFPRYRAEQVAGAFFGFVYVGVMLSCIYELRAMTDGAYLVWLIFLASWGSDTCAYCVGMLIGKHQMSPRLSPKKSVEGAVGGVVGAALLGTIYACAISSALSGSARVVLFAVICAIGALISMVGDLAASAIKRNHDIKDYGTLIPGHGGILDRFDSVIFVAPVIYYLARILMNSAL